jgi:hypothetical protein
LAVLAVISARGGVHRSQYPAPRGVCEAGSTHRPAPASMSDTCSWSQMRLRFLFQSHVRLSVGTSSFYPSRSDCPKI